MSKNVIIDEDRLLSLYRTYWAKITVGHNSIVTEINWYQTYGISDKDKQILITKETLRIFKSLTSSKELQQILQDAKDVKIVYDN